MEEGFGTRKGVWEWSNSERTTHRGGIVPALSLRAGRVPASFLYGTGGEPRCESIINGAATQTPPNPTGTETWPSLSESCDEDRWRPGSKVR